MIQPKNRNLEMLLNIQWDPEDQLKVKIQYFK
jgi:hypothetical protein